MKVLLATGYAELPAGTATGVARLAKPFMQSDLEGAMQALGTAVA